MNHPLFGKVRSLLHREGVQAYVNDLIIPLNTMYKDMGSEAYADQIAPYIESFGPLWGYEVVESSAMLERVVRLIPQIQIHARVPPGGILRDFANSPHLSSVVSLEIAPEGVHDFPNTFTCHLLEPGLLSHLQRVLTLAGPNLQWLTIERLWMGHLGTRAVLDQTLTLSKLRHLRLRGCQINSGTFGAIMEGSTQLHSLTHLSLIANRISSIPYSPHPSRRLQEINLKHNPLDPSTENVFQTWGGLNPSLRILRGS